MFLLQGLVQMWTLSFFVDFVSLEKGQIPERVQPILGSGGCKTEGSVVRTGRGRVVGKRRVGSCDGWAVPWTLPSRILQSSKGYRKQWTENSKNGIPIPVQSMRLAIDCSEPGGMWANLSAAMALKTVGECGWFWNLQEDLSVPHFNHLPIYLFLLYGS